MLCGFVERCATQDRKRSGAPIRDPGPSYALRVSEKETLLGYSVNRGKRKGLGVANAPPFRESIRSLAPPVHNPFSRSFTSFRGNFENRFLDSKRYAGLQEISDYSCNLTRFLLVLDDTMTELLFFGC